MTKRYLSILAVSISSLGSLVGCVSSQPVAMSYPAPSFDAPKVRVTATPTSAGGDELSGHSPSTYCPKAARSGDECSDGGDSVGVDATSSGSALAVDCRSPQ